MPMRMGRFNHRSQVWWSAGGQSVVVSASSGPSPPWRLVGEYVVAWVGGGVSSSPALRTLLPLGVRPLPGPAALVAVSYSDSPVGPYLELSLGVPARIGLRPGLCVVFQVVSVPGARLAYRTAWGLPANLAELSWSSSADGDRTMRCESLRLSMRGVPRGPSLPAVVPVRSVQRRADGPVVLPRRFVALIRMARVEVTMDEPTAGAAVSTSAELSLASALAGSHAGAVMSGVRILARPARVPAGLWSSLRAPLAVPEPLGGATTVASRTGA
jgi:hypothetical protein